MGLTVTGVSKSFGSFQAIKDLSMEVREGVLFGFLGANGAGKTTTMRMILDLFRPDSGQITWNGIDVREVPRRAWGYMPEERGLNAQIELLLRQALTNAGRMPRNAAPLPRRGRPLAADSEHSAEEGDAAP